ncbi:MAG: alpha/beta fold hydrolase [Candidatus Woesebacteria bacterium]|nr:MAG: alpha/beta fold hydrolase [Candidatus Woesebacteria bacterium]
MNLIKTTSFELAVNTRGGKNSERVVIMLPGKLDTKDYANFVSHQEYLAGKGFYTVAVDPPGTWESPGGIELFTTTNYLKAVNELIEYYGNKPTLLLGHSRGGNVAILASVNPNVIGIILVMSSYEPPTPPKSVKDGVQIEHRDIPPGSERTKEQKEFALPIEYFKDGEKFDTLAVLKKCQKPKLLFSGTDDRYYTPKEIEEIYESIPMPKMLHELNSDHGYRRHREIVEEVNKVIEGFIDKYLN